MKNNIKIILAVILVIGLGAGYYGYKEFNREHKDTSSLTVNEKIDAIALVNAFEADESAANTKFLNKVIQVTGKLQSAEKDKDGIITVYLESESMMATVSCQLEKDKNYTLESFTKGNSITITGLCSGYLTDVVLMRCVVN